MPLNVTILGLDALGASLGLALGTLDPKTLDVGRPRVMGWDTQKKVLQTARDRLVIDEGTTDLVAAVRGADVVWVNVPEDMMRQTFTSIAPHLKHGAVITDTASVKAPVMAWARELLPTTVQFIGGHPFAALGSDFQMGSGDALRGVVYCLVPAPTTAQGALDGLSEVITAIGAKPYFIDALEHDSYAAGAAHLPLIMAIALMETLSRGGGWREIQPIAGQGLADTTALVVNEPEASAGALHANRAALIHWLDGLEETLGELRAALDNPRQLTVLAEHAASARNAWLASSPNVRPGEDGIYSSSQDLPKASGTLKGMLFGRRSTKRKGA